MKSIIKLSLIIALVSLYSNSGFAQEPEKKNSKIDTAKFEVKGVCNMCKDRIENAALIKGVKFAEWDKASDTLTVIYRKDKLEIIKVHKSIAEAGHTTDKVECNMEAYNNLSACCKYMGDIEKH